MPEINLTHTSYIVLGLIEFLGPSSPYDLKRTVAQSLGNFWSIPHTQLYTEPERLAAAGYLDEKREETGRRRKLYSITAAGRRAMREWRDEPTGEHTELRDPGLLKLFFGSDPKPLAEMQLASHEAKLAEYEAIREQIKDDPRLRGPVLTLDAGIAHSKLWISYWRELAE